MVIVKKSKHQKKFIKHKLANGKLPLRVFGSEATGFKLAAEVAEDQIVPLGNVYDKQKDAVDAGQAKYNQKARKIGKLALAA